MKNPNLTQIYRSGLQFLLLSLSLSWVPAALWIDVVIIGHRVPETGVTEISQEILLAVTALLFSFLAWRKPEARGFLVLVAGFFWTLLIREMDHELDQLQHGAWKFFAYIIIAITFGLAVKYKSSIWQPMAGASQQRDFHYILIGLAILLILSRLLGTGSFWQAVLTANNYAVSASLIKSIIQEGIELQAYIIIFWGALNYYLQTTPSRFAYYGACRAARQKPAP